MDLVGRYIKVINPNMGGEKSKYKKGDILPILYKYDSGVCWNVKYVGTLDIGYRLEVGDIKLFPEDFNSINESFYEVY